MTVDYIKYVIKKCLLGTYTYAIIDIKQKELIANKYSCQKGNFTIIYGSKKEIAARLNA